MDTSKAFKEPMIKITAKPGQAGAERLWARTRKKQMEKKFTGKIILKSSEGKIGRGKKVYGSESEATYETSRPDDNAFAKN